VRAVSLFSGAGYLCRGMKLALPCLQITQYVELDHYAQGCIRHAFRGGVLNEAPIHGDIKTYHGTPMSADLVYGGFPCTDISTAGLGAGLDGSQSGLWHEMARVIGEIKPSYVFIENVAAICKRGLNRVLHDIASMGFDAEWEVCKARDVGAPHQERARCFVLAYAKGKRRPLPNMDGEITAGPANSGEVLAATANGRAIVQRHRWPAPAGAFGSGIEGLRVQHTQWRSSSQPALCRKHDGSTHGIFYSNDGYAVLGNGVVPVLAALAFRSLAERADLYDSKNLH